MSTTGRNDHFILDTLATHPAWLETKVLSRLQGYPDPDSCWLWGGSTSTGYGTVRLPVSIEARSPVYSHRAVWLAAHGPIPAGLVLDHDGPAGCHNRRCANPGHLFCVTQHVNIVVTSTSASAKNARKTHCPKGHPLTGDNLVAAVTKRGGRNCRACHQENARRQHVALKTAAQTLGVTKAKYVSIYGRSLAAALRIAEGKAS